jgi:hypothetical protein
VYEGAPPGWNAKPAGFTDVPDRMPYVVAAGGTVMGYFWTFPLRAGHRDNPSNKILWYVRLPRAGHSLVVPAYPRGETRPLVSYEFAANTSPGEIYPTAIDVPRPGCWTIELSWGAHKDRLDLRYLPGP